MSKEDESRSAKNFPQIHLRTEKIIIEIIGDAKAKWMINSAKRERESRTRSPQSEDWNQKQYEFNKRPQVIFCRSKFFMELLGTKRIESTKRNVKAQKYRQSLKRLKIKKFF